MSAYEELVERVVRTAGSHYEADADIGRAILAEVLRTLETMTPEMEREWGAAGGKAHINGSGASRDWLAMLRASPLSPK